MTIIVRDQILREKISFHEATAAFDALLEVCNWILTLLEITHPELAATEEKKSEQEAPKTTKMLRRLNTMGIEVDIVERDDLEDNVIHDILPEILETAVIALWGCAAAVRKEMNLVERVTKHMSKESVLTRRRRRATSAEIFSEDTQIQDELWMDVCQKLTYLVDPRVPHGVSVNAVSVIGYMIQHPGCAFKHDTLSHLLKLLEPWQGLALRASACTALSRLCASELNLAKQKKNRPLYSEKWSKFCQVILSSCGIDILFQNTMQVKSISYGDKNLERELQAETELRMASACCILYMCAQYKGVMQKGQLGSLISLLTCETQHHVQLYAASAVWCMARNEENRKVLGKLGACKRVMKLLFSTKSKQCREWCAASLWLLCSHEPNAIEVAGDGYAMSKLIQLMRPDDTWDAHNFMKRNQNLLQDDDVLIQNVVGCLRRCVATEVGSTVVSRQKLGFTLIDSLISIVKMSVAKIELLREAAGLIFHLQETPENLEYIGLVAKSSTALEDLYLSLLKRTGHGQEYLHMEAAHALTGLCCKHRSRLHVGRHGGVKLLEGMMKENLHILGALDLKFEQGTADNLDNLEFEEIYENLRICIVAILNLSVELEFHVDIAELMLKPLLEFAYDDDDRIIGTIACKIICNLERSSHFKVQTLIYKEQLRMASDLGKKESMILESKESEIDSVITFGKKFGDNKRINETRRKVLSYLKGTLCPKWFTLEFPLSDRNR